MNKHIAMILAGGLACAAYAEDGFQKDLSTGWRFSVGPQFNFNANGRIGVKSGAISVPAPVFGGNRSAAQASGDKVSFDGERKTFPNGAYIDPDDAAGVSGETWNWHVPAGELDGGVMSFSYGYSEHSIVYDTFGGNAKDDNYSVGIGFGLDRTVWKYVKSGVDAGFNFSFFRKENWFKGSAGGYVRTDTYTEGTYHADVDLGNGGVLENPWAQNPDGSYGAGSFDGPGPVLNLDEISVSHRYGEESVSTATTSYGPLSIRGDLQMYEFQWALKPYYELTDWFVVRGTVGVGLDYRSIDVKVSGAGSASDHDWDCYMIAGLGGMFHWKGVCMGADFLRKVFDSDMDVNTRYVEGSISNASWMLRAYVGYEF